MSKVLRQVFVARPWYGGVLLALIPIVWLWTNYPIALDSRSVSGTVVKAELSQKDQLVNTGSQGVVNVSSYEVRVTFVFDVGQHRHIGTQSDLMSNLAFARQQVKAIEGRTVTVIYSSHHPERAFVFELISKAKLKWAAGLSVMLLIFGTLIVGRLAGTYNAYELNVSLDQIKPRFLVAGGLLLLFYVWLIWM